jgi:hypothetical protein
MEKIVREKPLTGLDVAEESEEYPVATERGALVLQDEHYQISWPYVLLLSGNTLRPKG